jgi:hypothetical protein
LFLQAQKENIFETFCFGQAEDAILDELSGNIVSEKVSQNVWARLHFHG